MGKCGIQLKQNPHKSLCNEIKQGVQLKPNPRKKLCDEIKACTKKVSFHNDNIKRYRLSGDLTNEIKLGKQLRRTQTIDLCNQIKAGKELKPTRNKCLCNEIKEHYKKTHSIPKSLAEEI